MKKFLFPEGRKFYKANLHCHTTVSDGKKTPAEIKAMYRVEGYDAVAFTDHEALLLHDDLTDDCFVALNGYETAIKETNGVSTDSFLRVHHLCLIKRRPADNTQVCFYPENFTPGNCRTQIPFLRYAGEICEYSFDHAFLAHLIDEAHRHGFLVHYNHPRWSLMSAEDILPIPFDGLEICNTGCRFHGDFDADTYEDYLRLGGDAYIVGGDDNHNGGYGDEDDSFGAFTMVCAKELTYEALTDAIAEGATYVSTGPEILSAYVEGGMLVVRTSPAARILLHGEGRKIYSHRGRGGYIDRAAFPLDEAQLGRFFRLEVIDKVGAHAYTRAYYLEDLI